MYADFHCHPAAFAYNPTRLADSQIAFTRNPWAIPQSEVNEANNSFNFSHSDLVKCVRSGTKLLFASLSPPEKGYFTGVSNTPVDKDLIHELYERWHKEGDQASSAWLLNQLHTIPAYKKLRLSDLQFLNQPLMNLQSGQVNKIQNGEYDYFEELKQEYRFFLHKSGQLMSTPEAIQVDEASAKKKWSGEYHLASNAKEVNPCDQTDKITIVPTLGGIHSLGIGNAEEGKDIPIQTLKSRIRQLKGEEALDDTELTTWKHRPFYITFAGHFYNTLCGHAKSFTSHDSILFDQRRGIDQGVMSHCHEVWRELLGLNESLEPTGSKRILIDVCHMSAAARYSYYKELIFPFNRDNKENKIPVIASHAAYAGVDYLETMISNCKNRKEQDNFFINGFLAWSINLSDEDVLQIFHSEGLLGLSLDERLLGGGSNFWWKNFSFGALERRRSLALLRKSLEQFVCIPFAYHVANPHTIWDRIGMGSDFDGYMKPIQRYSSVLQFSTLEQDLVEILSDMKRDEPLWFGSYQPEDLARKICFENAYEFVKKHY